MIFHKLSKVALTLAVMSIIGGLQLITADIIVSTAKAQTAKEEPDPYFPSSNYREGYDYSLAGTIIGVTITKELRNRGGSGEVFVSLTCKENNLSASKVFYMDKDESALVEVHFALSTSYFYCPFKFTTRAALPDDTSQGEIRVIRLRSTMRPIGHLDIGNVKEIAVSGDFAYVIVEKEWPYNPDTAFMADISLKVIDVSDPSNPREVGHYDFNPANIAFSKYAVRAAGHYVYVAIGHYDECDDNGLHIIDVSNPSEPHEVSQYRIEGGAYDAYDVAVAANYAYVAIDEDPHTYGRGESLLVLDVSTPSDPKNVGKCELSFMPERIAVKDSYAYCVTCYKNSLHVIDISKPDCPEVTAQDYELSSGYVSGTRESIAISGSYAYIGTRECSLVVFDIDSSNPTMISEHSLSEDCAGYDIAVSGNYAYMVYYADGLGGLYAIDVSNPSVPIEAGRYSEVGMVGKCVAVSNNYVYLGGSGLYIFTQLSSEPNISVSPTSHDFGDVTVGSTSTAQTFIISNMGTADLAIDTISLTGTNTSEFFIQNNNCSAQTIAPSETCTVDVVFSPTSEGSKSANLSMPSNDPGTLTLEVPLSGTGVRAGVMPGDANGDGNTNVQDVVCIINVILDTGTASGSLDCNGDGDVNVLDVVCVINKILGG